MDQIRRISGRKVLSVEAGADYTAKCLAELEWLVQKKEEDEGTTLDLE
jgi:hypothetical protein